jgi:hypothetical protein
MELRRAERCLKYQIRESDYEQRHQGSGDYCEQKPVEPRTPSRNVQHIFGEVLLENGMG